MSIVEIHFKLILATLGRIPAVLVQSAKKIFENCIFTIMLLVYNVYGHLYKQVYRLLTTDI